MIQRERERENEILREIQSVRKKEKRRIRDKITRRRFKSNERNTLIMSEKRI